MSKPLQIGHFPAIDHLTLGVALHNDADMDVSSKLYTSWPSIADGLVSGEVDGAYLLFPLAFDLFKKGLKAKLLILGHREGQVLVARKGIAKMEDLKGKTVFVPDIHSTHHILLHIAFGKVGLTLDDVEVRTGFTHPRDMDDMLERGEIDAFVAAEPMGSEAERRDIGTILKLSHDVSPHHADCARTVRDDAIENNREGVANLVENLVKAGLFINAYPRQAAEIGEDFLGWKKKILLRSLTHNKAHILFWDLLPRVEDFEEMQRIAVEEMHLWDKGIDVKEFIDSSFAQEAYREWVVDTRRSVKDKGEERTLPVGFEEAAKRFAAFFRGATSVAGLKRSGAGEKYPNGVERIERMPGNTADFLEDVFLGKSYVASADSAKIKGLAFVQPELIPEPDRVLFRLSEDEALKALQALHWGDRITEVQEYNEDTAERQLFSFAENISVVKKGEDVYFSVDFTVFRFLVLLLHHV